MDGSSHAPAISPRARAGATVVRGSAVSTAPSPVVLKRSTRGDPSRLNSSVQNHSSSALASSLTQDATAARRTAPTPGSRQAAKPQASSEPPSASASMSASAASASPQSPDSSGYVYVPPPPALPVPKLVLPRGGAGAAPARSPRHSAAAPSRSPRQSAAAPSRSPRSSLDFSHDVGPHRSPRATAPNQLSSTVPSLHHSGSTRRVVSTPPRQRSSVPRHVDASSAAGLNASAGSLRGSVSGTDKGTRKRRAEKEAADCGTHPPAPPISVVGGSSTPVLSTRGKRGLNSSTSGSDGAGGGGGAAGSSLLSSGRGWHSVFTSNHGLASTTSSLNSTTLATFTQSNTSTAFGITTFTGSTSGAHPHSVRLSASNSLSSTQMALLGGGSSRQHSCSRSVVSGTSDGNPRPQSGRRARDETELREKPWLQPPPARGILKWTKVTLRSTKKTATASLTQTSVAAADGQRRSRAPSTESRGGTERTSFPTASRLGSVGGAPAPVAATEKRVCFDEQSVQVSGSGASHVYSDDGLGLSLQSVRTEGRSRALAKSAGVSAHVPPAPSLGTRSRPTSWGEDSSWFNEQFGISPSESPAASPGAAVAAATAAALADRKANQTSAFDSTPLNASIDSVDKLNGSVKSVTLSSSVTESRMRTDGPAQPAQGVLSPPPRGTTTVLHRPFTRGPAAQTKSSPTIVHASPLKEMNESVSPFASSPSSPPMAQFTPPPLQISVLRGSTTSLNSSSDSHGRGIAQALTADGAEGATDSRWTGSASATTSPLSSAGQSPTLSNNERRLLRALVRVNRRRQNESTADGPDGITAEDDAATTPLTKGATAVSSSQTSVLSASGRSELEKDDAVQLDTRARQQLDFGSTRGASRPLAPKDESGGAESACEEPTATEPTQSPPPERKSREHRRPVPTADGELPRVHGPSVQGTRQPSNPHATANVPPQKSFAVVPDGQPYSTQRIASTRPTVSNLRSHPTRLLSTSPAPLGDGASLDAGAIDAGGARVGRGTARPGQAPTSLCSPAQRVVAVSSQSSSVSSAEVESEPAVVSNTVVVSRARPRNTRATAAPGQIRSGRGADGPLLSPRKRQAAQSNDGQTAATTVPRNSQRS